MVVPGATSTTPRVGKLGGSRQKSRKFLIQSRLASLGGVSRSFEALVIIKPGLLIMKIDFWAESKFFPQRPPNFFKILGFCDIHEDDLIPNKMLHA